MTRYEILQLDQETKRVYAPVDPFKIIFDRHFMHAQQIIKNAIEKNGGIAEISCLGEHILMRAEPGRIIKREDH